MDQEQRRLDGVIDPDSGIEARLRILTAEDGGASAVIVALRNLAPDDDLVLKLNTEVSAVVMLTVADQTGAVLSTPAKTFTTEETQTFDLVRITGGSSQSLHVPLAGQLPAAAVPEAGLDGRLVANIGVIFQKVGPGVEPNPDAYQRSLLTLYDMAVRFTRAALHADPAFRPDA